MDHQVEGLTMTPRQRRFVDEYLIDLCATQAAIRAGYSARTAEQIGHRLLRNVQVAEAIAAAQAERSKRTGIAQDRVLLELARVAFFDIRRLFQEDGSLKAVCELDHDSAAALSGIETVEDFSDAASEEPEEQPHGGALKRRRALVGYVKKVKLWDKTAALALSMRHLGMLNDKLTIPGGLTVVVKDYTGRNSRRAPDKAGRKQA